MTPTLVLTRAMLETFTICQRRFQLRYLESLPWPALFQKPQDEKARRLGEMFHQMLERHFLGLPEEAAVDPEPELVRWWSTFLAWEPSLPAGKRLPEFTLTVPMGAHFISGRMDLIVITQDSIHIYDWKTGTQPPSKEHLWLDLQTRLYLTLAAEGAAAIGSPAKPTEISLAYWYASEPPAVLRLNYDGERHRHFRQGFQEIIEQLDSMLNLSGKWALTQDLSHCRRCAYQIICDREADSPDLASWELDEPELEPESEFEPEWD